MENATQELQDAVDTQLLKHTTAFGYYDHNFVGLCQHLEEFPNNGDTRSIQRIWRVRAKQVILSTGSIERPLVFANNDRPGVILAGATRTYANRYGVAVGHRVCIFTNNDDAYRTALDLNHAGVKIPAIVDLRTDPSGDLVLKTIEAGIEIIDGAAITHIEGARAVK